MTTTQANQLSTLYNQLVLHEGDKVLLWTNPSPTSEFAAQTISVSLSGYRYCIIVFRVTNADTLSKTFSDNTCSNHIYPIPCSANIAATDRNNTTVNGGSSTRQTIITTSSVIFSVGAWGGVSNNAAMIPLEIYGI